MGWNNISNSLFGTPDDGRVMQWVTGPSVKPYLDELQRHIPFGDTEGRRGPNKSTIVQLCVRSNDLEDGKYTRDKPTDYATFTTAERYARAVSLIVRENSYDGGLLRRQSLDFPAKCQIVLEMISLVRQESSSERRGRFNPDRSQENVEIDRRRTLVPSAEVLEATLAPPAEVLEAEGSRVILNEQVVLLHPFRVQSGNSQIRPSQWPSLPKDERELYKLIKEHENFLTVLEKTVVRNLDFAGASSIDKDFGPRTKAKILGNLQEDVLAEEFQLISSELVICGIFRALRQCELDAMAKAHEYFSIHANKGPPYTECLSILHIENAEKPWLPGTSPSCVFYPFQIQGIAWLLQMTSSPIHGAILGDDMGLGKTYQACGLIQAFVNARAREENPIDKYGKAKVSLIVVPPIVLSAWQDVLKSNFPELTVKLYGPGTTILKADDLPKGETAASYIILSTYPIMERHSLKMKTDWQKENPTTPWPQDLTSHIGTMILDEAHNIKRAQNGIRWSALKLLQADRVVCMTGTLFDNKVEDINGPLGLISPDELWSKLKTPLTFNPFEVESGDPRAALQCTTGALNVWIKRCKDPVKKGIWLQKLLGQIMRKTTYETIFRGRKIGELIPPMREVVVELVYDAEVLSQYQSVAQRLGEGLITIEEGAHGQLVVRFHMDIHRTLTIVNIWYPLELVSKNWPAKRVEEFRGNKGDLRAFLLDMAKDPSYRWLGPKPLSNCNNREMVREIARMSPLIRFTLSLVRYFVVVLRRKLLVWTDYPLSQLFVELVIDAVGIQTTSLHSGLNTTDREDVIRMFNRPSSTLQVLVMNTLVGNVGINLQHACSNQVMLGTTSSDPQERQCLARLHRFGQTEEVTAWKPVVKGSYAEGQRLKRFLKVVADLVAHLDIERLKAEGTVGTLTLNSDIGQEVGVLWQELQGAVGMPQDPSWLYRLGSFRIEGEGV